MSHQLVGGCQAQQPRPGAGLFPAVDYDEAWLARLARTGGLAPLLSFASLGVSFALVPPRATDGPRGPASLDALEPLRSVALSVALSVRPSCPTRLTRPPPGVGFVDGAPATPEVPSTWPPLTPVVWDRPGPDAAQTAPRARGGGTLPRACPCSLARRGRRSPERRADPGTVRCWTDADR